MIPVLILMAMGIASLTQHITLHGQTRQKEYNGGYMFVALLAIWGLYYWAGLFDVFFN